MALYEKAIFTKSLLSLLQAIQGKHTTVDLRNETSVSGIILSVDSAMNLQMSEAVMSYNPDTKHSSLFIKGKQIRYVHIPSDVDVAKTLASQMKGYKDRGQYDERAKRQPAATQSRKRN